VKKILQQPNGARFYKCDLHIHTPQDKRFKVPKDIDFNTDRGKKAFAHLFVTSAIDKGIEIIAITEHNSVEWVDLIRDAAENTNLHVFPGFEINTKSGAGGIHLLCIFNPTTSSSTLDDIITQLGLPRNDRFHGDGSCKLCNKSIAETIEFINDQGGLTIAAHVLSEHGILKSESMKGEVRVKAWNNPTLSAAELPNPRFTLEKKANFIGRVLRNEAELYKRERSIAPVYLSDARSLSEIGSQYTLVKLSSITIGGLQQAFLDGNPVYVTLVKYLIEISPE
jgi:PHP family Zn ribbon phosphoesterase